MRRLARDAALWVPGGVQGGVTMSTGVSFRLDPPTSVGTVRLLEHR